MNKTFICFNPLSSLTLTNYTQVPSGNAVIDSYVSGAVSVAGAKKISIHALGNEMMVPKSKGASIYIEGSIRDTANAFSTGLVFTPFYAMFGNIDSSAWATAPRIACVRIASATAVGGAPSHSIVALDNYAAFTHIRLRSDIYGSAGAYYAIMNIVE